MTTKKSEVKYNILPGTCYQGTSTQGYRTDELWYTLPYHVQLNNAKSMSMVCTCTHMRNKLTKETYRKQNKRRNTKRNKTNTRSGRGLNLVQYISCYQSTSTQGYRTDELWYTLPYHVQLNNAKSMSMVCTCTHMRNKLTKET